MEESNCHYAPEPHRGQFEKLMRKLFPSQWVELPEAPATYADCLVMKTVTYFDWKDRCRVIVSGRIVTESKIVCENSIGATVPNTVCYVLRPGATNPE